VGYDTGLFCFPNKRKQTAESAISKEIEDVRSKRGYYEIVKSFCFALKQTRTIIIIIMEGVKMNNLSASKINNMIPSNVPNLRNFILRSSLVESGAGSVFLFNHSRVPSYTMS
jgi:hypothetical protein